jgi:hypothetical protein
MRRTTTMGQIEVVIDDAVPPIRIRTRELRPARCRPRGRNAQHRAGLWLPQANVDSLSGSAPKTNRRPVTLSGRIRTKCGFGVAVQGNSHARLASSSSSSVRGARAVPLTITLQPSSAVLPSASNNTSLLIAELTNLVPSAVRNSTLRCCTTKLTGKISGWPSTLVTSRPSATLPRRFQHSVTERIEIGARESMDMPATVPTCNGHWQGHRS